MRQYCQEAHYIKKVPWLSHVEQRKNKTTLHPLSTPPHPTQSFKYNKLNAPRSSVPVRLYTTQSCEYFRPVPFSLPFDVCSFVGGGCSRRHNHNSKEQQYLPNIFAVTVNLVAHGRSLHFPSFPAGSYHVSALSQYY